MKGYVQIYTGNGKGKTTAALGAALRAAGAGYYVFIGQFLKGMNYSELNALKHYRNLIEVEQYGRRYFIKDKPDSRDIKLAQEGFARCRKIVENPKYGMVILDEINIAVYFKLLAVESIIDLIQNKTESVELILTGRYAHERLIQMADLVTEMKEIKHYFHKGVNAREGIEK
ncbi:cob(I)yrinic acid a,c-diamide adenosyltransferase [candidate division KSB1 bacterium]|nr:cob(I)yrinic acid a,c-diamide adenosyltransferase [candidate division KSB1 bacterium]